MLKIKIGLKAVFGVFLFAFSLFFVLKGNAYAAAGGGSTSATCELGTMGSCPTIGSFKRANGTEEWPVQASDCKCSKGQWTTCDYPSAEFYDISGSCANNNYRIRKCNFTQQSIACNSSSVSVKYTCGAWENGDCTGSCSPAGSKEEKYTASGCSYTTQTRTCCSNGKWSDWDKSCTSCSSSQCWNGSKCENKEAVTRNCSGNVTNATGGTQTRTATCKSGTGWSYGSWSGTCTCKSNYGWNGGSCIRRVPSIHLECQIVPDSDRGNVIWVGAQADYSPAAFRVPVVFTLLCEDDNGQNAHTVQGTFDVDFPAGTLRVTTENSVNNQCYPPKNVAGCTLSNGNIYWL